MPPLRSTPRWRRPCCRCECARSCLCLGLPPAPVSHGVTHAQYLQGRFGNPSSGHWYGVKEKVRMRGWQGKGVHPSAPVAASTHPPSRLSTWPPRNEGHSHHVLTSPSHRRRMQAACEAARSHVAALIGASDSKDVIFTSGGTESVNWAIKVRPGAPRRALVVVMAQEGRVSLVAHPHRRSYPSRALRSG